MNTDLVHAVFLVRLLFFSFPFLCTLESLLTQKGIGELVSLQA